MKWLAIGGVGIVVLGIGVAFLVRSCTADKAAAERTVAALYEAISRGDYDAAVGFYHPQLIAGTTREKFTTDLVSVNRKLGGRRDGHLAGWEIVTGSDAWVDLTCEAEYENGHVVEVFRLVRVDGEYRVIVHNYESDVLLR